MEYFLHGAGPDAAREFCSRITSGRFQWTKGNARLATKRKLTLEGIDRFGAFQIRPT